MSGLADPAEFARRWNAAFDAHDVDAVLELFHDDVVFTSPLAARVMPESGGVIRGKAALHEYWTAALAERPTLRFELTSLQAYRGPRDSTGAVTAANIFRGPMPGSLIGPYISQYLLKTIYFGSTPREQMYRTGVVGYDYMTERPTEYDPPKLFARQKAAVMDMTKEHIRLFGSDGKAW